MVIGDSTAAAIGNAGLAHPSPDDRRCGRTADTYAADLALVNRWNVLNLACSGATVQQGLLGPQTAGGAVLPPQLAVAKTASRARVLIVSVGADDLHWSAVLRLCAATRSCDNGAIVAYFQRQLALFSSAYYDLLKQLAVLPHHPAVVVNLYYDPFGAQSRCLSEVGLTAAKQHQLVGLLDALNSVLAKGAAASSFRWVAPSFSGHSLCSAEPYVQGLGAPAPFHPTAAGELAIALADQRVIEGVTTGRAPAGPT